MIGRMFTREKNGAFIERALPLCWQGGFDETTASRIASQRGLSSRNGVISVNARAGTASAPSITRHVASPNSADPIHQFTNCETTMPRTMLNWKSPPSCPRLSAGEISAM